MDPNGQKHINQLIIIKILETEAAAINMSCNSKKTVCTVFSPINRRNIIGNSFPNFKLDGWMVVI